DNDDNFSATRVRVFARPLFKRVQRAVAELLMQLGDLARDARFTFPAKQRAGVREHLGKTMRRLVENQGACFLRKRFEPGTTCRCTRGQETLVAETVCRQTRCRKRRHY